MRVGATFKDGTWHEEQPPSEIVLAEFLRAGISEMPGPMTAVLIIAANLMELGPDWKRDDARRIFERAREYARAYMADNPWPWERIDPDANA